MGERISFNLTNFAVQEFPFPEKLIKYVNESADAEIKQMLDRTCKYFFANVPFLVVDTMEIDHRKLRIENEKYDGCMDFMYDNELEVFLEKVKFIWITRKIDVTPQHYLDRAFIAKIRRCDASEIFISNCDVDLNGFKFLTRSGKVEYMDITSTIFDEIDESLVPLEDVLSLVPTARVIKMSNCHVTRRTMKKLLAIPWKNKIAELSLTNVDRSLNANWFFAFVKKHLDPEAKIHVDFNFENDGFKKLYNQIVLKSGEKLPMFEMDAPPADIEIPAALETVPKKITFNDHDAERQYFAFPYPHMCYIRETADAETWKKFERTCKFFFPKNRYFMVDNLHVGADKKITLMTDNKKMVFEKKCQLGKPYWLTKSLHVLHPISLSMDNRIEARKIFISSLRICMRVLKLITKSGMVKEWNSIHTFVDSDDNKLISLVQLLSHLPNAEIVWAKVRGILPRNSIDSVSLPHRNNVKHLTLNFFKDPIIASSLFDVLTKTLAPKAIVHLIFVPLANEISFPQFIAELKTKLDTWKPQIERPTIVF